MVSDPVCKYAVSRNYDKKIYLTLTDDLGPNPNG